MPTAVRQLGSPLTLLVWALVGVACGPVHFVTSPYTPREVTITYSQQEDLTVFAWKLGADVDLALVRFELHEAGAWKPIDFASAPYPAGGFACDTGAATCFRFTRVGRYQPPLALDALRSIHPQHGTLMGLRAVIRELPTSLALVPHLLPGNDTLALGIDDAISPPKTPVRRSFKWRVEPSSQPCPASAPSWNGSTKGVEELPFTEALTDEGRYCVTIQPEPLVPLAVPTIAAPALTHPVLEEGKHDYVPPVEQSPVLYQVIFDLEIPNQQRCDDTIAQLETLLQALDKRGTAAHQFPPAFVSQTSTSRCRQDPGRHLAVAELAEAIKSYVATEVGTTRGARIVVIYANNLLLPIDQIAQDLSDLQASLVSDPRVATFFWGIASQGALDSFPFDEKTGWVNPWDKALQDTIKQVAKTTVPFETMLHDALTTVSFVEPHQASLPGQLKMCGATPKVQLTHRGHPVPDETLIVPVGPQEDVGYRVDLGEQVRVPAGKYEEKKVEARYEICRRWCDHPFQTTTGEWLGPQWLQQTRCREGT